MTVRRTDHVARTPNGHSVALLALVALVLVVVCSPLMRYGGHRGRDGASDRAVQLSHPASFALSATRGAVGQRVVLRARDLERQLSCRLLLAILAALWLLGCAGVRSRRGDMQRRAKPAAFRAPLPPRGPPAIAA
jgi:hypothetical protein